jgi:hypothetical protein
MPSTKLIAATGAFALALIFAGVCLVDTTFHYIPVNGTIIAKTDACFIQDTKHKQSVPTCEEARIVTQPGHPFEGWKVMPATVITYSYVSPVDHALYTGNASREGEASHYAEVGTAWTIYAHKRNAEKSRYLAGWALALQKIISGPPASTL